LAGVSLDRMVAESKPSEDGPSASRAAPGTAHVTPSERQKGPVARHVVCSATRGGEDLGPNRKFRLKPLAARCRSFYVAQFDYEPL